MADLTRRNTLAALLGGPAVATLAGEASAAPSAPTWTRGPDGQRRADLGDGTYLNPVFPGDHPDPTILRDGDAWYVTFSSFDAYPGLLIWRSVNLVNWTPLTAALKTPIGSVWAPELTKHNGRYYLYIPARTPPTDRPGSSGRIGSRAPGASRSTSGCPTTSIPAMPSARTVGAICS